MYDLIVVGGGPAGSSAAITAARGGASVLLLERGKYPRHKVCGEFVSAESLALLRSLLLSHNHPVLDDALRIAQGRIFLDGQVVHTSIAPPAASIARFDLDALLYESALAAGVQVRIETSAQAIAGTGPFRVQTARENFETRAVINASGRWSSLTAVPVANPQKWLGIKAHFAESAPASSVDLYFFEGGYCGVQPVALRSDLGAHCRINAAAMVRADVASSLPRIFALNPALARRSREWQPLSDPVTTSPLIFRKPQPVRDGVLNVGDAAAFVDPFVGDGISLALRSGVLAAECADADIYAQEYRRRFGSVFRVSSQLRRLLRLPRQVRKPLLTLLAHTPAVRQYLVTGTR